MCFIALKKVKKINSIIPKPDYRWELLYSIYKHNINENKFYEIIPRKKIIVYVLLPIRLTPIIVKKIYKYDKFSI
jgi:hypothetical protein